MTPPTTTSGTAEIDAILAAIGTALPDDLRRAADAAGRLRELRVSSEAVAAAPGKVSAASLAADRLVAGALRGQAVEVLAEEAFSTASAAIAAAAQADLRALIAKSAHERAAHWLGETVLERAPELGELLGFASDRIFEAAVPAVDALAGLDLGDPSVMASLTPAQRKAWDTASELASGFDVILGGTNRLATLSARRFGAGGGDPRRWRPGRRVPGARMTLDIATQLEEESWPSHPVLRFLHHARTRATAMAQLEAAPPVEPEPELASDGLQIIRPLTSRPE